MRTPHSVGAQCLQPHETRQPVQSYLSTQNGERMALELVIGHASNSGYLALPLTMIPEAHREL